ncbi:MAG: DUF1993 domain-containing protein [Rhodospirillales bacterium]|nr:DUF1993 domain-containing protein [Rhodospirillales bacterium]
MPISMYQITVPVFTKMLGALSNVLDKGAAFAAAKKVDPSVLLASRLAPDMFPLTRQVQLASDFAKGPLARLSGSEPPKWEDSETTFDALKARIAKTVDFAKSFKPEQIDGSETRDVTITIGGNPVTMKGQEYLLHNALPNFYFHVTAAYAILRHNGVEVGKRDYLGRT